MLFYLRRDILQKLLADFSENVEDESIANLRDDLLDAEIRLLIDFPEGACAA